MSPPFCLFQQSIIGEISVMLEVFCVCCPGWEPLTSCRCEPLRDSCVIRMLNIYIFYQLHLNLDRHACLVKTMLDRAGPVYQDNCPLSELLFFAFCIFSQLRSLTNQTHQKCWCHLEFITVTAVDVHFSKLKLHGCYHTILQS